MKINNPKSTKEAYLIMLIILTTIFILCVIIYNSTNIELLNSISLNLMSEIIGIGITIGVVDRLIKINENIEKKRIQDVVIKELKYPLKDLGQLIFNMYKSTIQMKADKDYKYIRDLLKDEDFLNNVFHLDFSKAVFCIPEKNWLQYFHEETQKFSDSLNLVLAKYAIYIDSELIEVFHNITDSKFMSLMLYKMPIYQYQNQSWYKLYDLSRISSMDVSECAIFRQEPKIWDDFKEFIYNIIRLMDKYYIYTQDDLLIDDSWWEDSIFIKIGSARAELKDNVKQESTLK